MELIPSIRERWRRLIWPWGIPGVILLSTSVASREAWALVGSMVILGWGAYEFATPYKMIIGPLGIQLIRLGRLGIGRGSGL